MQKIKFELGVLKLPIAQNSYFESSLLQFECRVLLHSTWQGKVLSNSLLYGMICYDCCLYPGTKKHSSTKQLGEKGCVDAPIRRVRRRGRASRVVLVTAAETCSALAESSHGCTLQPIPSSYTPERFRWLARSCNRRLAPSG